MNERDLAKKPFTKDEISKLLEDHNIRDFINPKSTPYKALGLNLESLSKEEMLDLLSKEVNLFKRPFVIKQDLVLFGFSESEYKKLLD